MGVGMDELVFSEITALDLVLGVALDLAGGVALDFIVGVALDFIVGVALDFIVGMALDFVVGVALDFVVGLEVDMTVVVVLATVEVVVAMELMTDEDSADSDIQRQPVMCVRMCMYSRNLLQRTLVQCISVYCSEQIHVRNGILSWL